MKVAQLSGSPRANVGKKDAKALRAAGQVPCVLYGQGSQIHFSLDDVKVEKLIYNPDVFKIELDVDGKKVNAVIQDLQQHPVTDKVMHIDFLELNDKKPVKIALPVRLTGSSRGVMAGGKLMQVFRRLRVVGLPGALPEAITIDISGLRIGQSIRVKDLETEGLTIAEAKNAVVVAVKMARGASKAAEQDDEE
ncbi:MAG TPA: 50S ribosomal protein L25/general stress protein Ctc [Fluviicola sp.]|nr:50S ribosomal protein L25/general stress protein Ctc [Fluviicola sp.]